MRPQVLGAGIAVASALVVGIMVGPAGALERIPGPWRHPHGVSPGHGDDPHAARDSDRCAGPTTGPQAPPPAPGSLSQTVTVAVPALVRVQSAVDGLTVITNAGRPPAPGDQVYLLGPDGSYAPADDQVVDRVMTAHWRGGSWCSTTDEHRSAG